MKPKDNLNRLVNKIIDLYNIKNYEHGNVLYHHLVDEFRYYEKKGVDVGDIATRINKEIVVKYFHTIK